MKYLLTLLLGFGVGIGGEFLIPYKYQASTAQDCIVNGDITFMPALLVYDPIMVKYPTFLSSDRRIRSYEILFAFLLGKIHYLKTEECNKLVGLFIDGELEHYSQYFTEKKDAK